MILTRYGSLCSVDDIMNLSGRNLMNYPLQENYNACKDYLKNIDWNLISEEIKKDGIAKYDVSDAISLFCHLSLDENYRLICYIQDTYHGFLGKTAAIKNGDSIEPLNVSVSLLGHFDLPSTAVFPMEAIYSDGSDEGYLEAVLCELLLKAIPYEKFERPQRDIIITDPPGNINVAWNVYLDITDWNPRIYGNIIIAFKRIIENGSGSSDGRDRIYLVQYVFYNNSSAYRFSRIMNNSPISKIYNGEIEDDKRYNEKRRCCVFSESHILVANEKEYTAKWP